MKKFLPVLIVVILLVSMIGITSALAGVSISGKSASAFVFTSSAKFLGSFTDFGTVGDNQPEFIANQFFEIGLMWTRGCMVVVLTDTGGEMDGNFVFVDPLFCFELLDQV